MRTILFSFLICLASTLVAQDATLSKIKQQNEGYKTITGSFKQTITLATGKVTEKNGQLYFERTDKMSMHYEEPATDLLVINGDQFYMARGKRKNLFNTEKNKRMAELSNTLLCSMTANLEELAQENDAKLIVNSDAKYNVAILTAEKKQARGYKQIILSYDKKSGMLCQMQMDEWNGNSTLYVLTAHKANKQINEALFAIPENKEK